MITIYDCCIDHPLLTLKTVHFPHILCLSVSGTVNWLVYEIKFQCFSGGRDSFFLNIFNKFNKFRHHGGKWRSLQETACIEVVCGAKWPPTNTYIDLTQGSVWAGMDKLRRGSSIVWSPKEVKSCMRCNWKCTLGHIILLSGDTPEWCVSEWPLTVISRDLLSLICSKYIKLTHNGDVTSTSFISQTNSLVKCW